MATFVEYANRYDRIRSQLGNINIQTNLIANEIGRGAVLGDPDFVGRRLDSLDNQIDANIDALNALSEEIASSDLTASQQESLQRVIEATGEGYLDQQQRIVGLRRQAQQNTDEQKIREQTQPKNSAAEIVDNEQDAKAEGANVQSPQQEDLIVKENGRVVTQPENTNTGTNARQANTSDDVESNTTTATVGGNAVSSVGGDAPVVKAEQTQRTNTGNVAATAANEDAFTPPESTTATSTGKDGRVEVAKEFLQPIVSKPNLLSGLSSMTYGLSLYLLGPDDFGEFVTAEKKILPGSQLLIQSAGIPKGERNQWFNVDFYIENFELESVVGTQALGSPHNAVSLEFDIVEPNGITLLNRLNNAVIELIGQQPDKKKASAYAQTYMMVIRFYGYDGSGNPITAADLGLESTTDSDAIIEKFIPFMISNLTYKINTKATEYKIQGVCHGTNIAFSTQRGVVPFNVQLTASTVDQLFNGNAVMAETQGEDNENTGTNQTGSTQTVVHGLVQALNQQQQRLAGTSYEIPDQYEIIFEDPDIKNAKLIKPGNVSKNSASNQTSTQAAQKFLGSKVNYDKESKSWNVPAGMSIAQLLDLVLRTSSYITRQQDIYIDEKTGKPVGPSDPNAQPSSVPTVQWYRIKTQIKPLGYDHKRSAIAYKITYIVGKYQINTPRSAYFPPADYRGVHKLYNYWFTGQNSEVLDFEIDVNSNYFMVIGNDGRVDERAQGKFPVPLSYSTATGQTQQGGENGSTIPASNLSDRLYSAADVANGVIQIVGDPDWIQQTELVYNKSLSLTPFAPDGSVNYDSSEVLFELRFNPAQDYDLETGLTNVYENNRDLHMTTQDGVVTQVNVAQESLIWAATTVTSTFSEGKFTQRLQGVYREFNGATNAPINPLDQTVLSEESTVTKAQKNNLNNNTPKKEVTTKSPVVDAPTTFIYSADDDFGGQTEIGGA